MSDDDPGHWPALRPWFPFQVAQLRRLAPLSAGSCVLSKRRWRCADAFYFLLARQQGNKVRSGCCPPFAESSRRIKADCSVRLARSKALAPFDHSLNRRSLHSAVAFAPASVGMTRLSVPFLSSLRDLVRFFRLTPDLRPGLCCAAPFGAALVLPGCCPPFAKSSRRIEADCSVRLARSRTLAPFDHRSNCRVSPLRRRFRSGSGRDDKVESAVSIVPPGLGSILPTYPRTYVRGCVVPPPSGLLWCCLTAAHPSRRARGGSRPTARFG